VLASALLGEDPPELPVSHLVHLAGLFGISENRARVALSRMVAAGEATTEGGGRYRLAGPLLGRRARQQAGIRGATAPWDGDWWTVVVRAVGRSPEERAGRRQRLTRARLAECREGVWLRPGNLDLDPDPAGDPDVLVLTGRPAGDPTALAGDLWDLAGWADGANRLRQRLADAPTRGPQDLAPGFELSAEVIRHLTADPLLPDALLPDGWPGADLRADYDGWDVRYRQVLSEWGRAAGADGPVATAAEGTSATGRS
jgi:phenylacetic acid degradation operon negative regulatory protein